MLLTPSIGIGSEWECEVRTYLKREACEGMLWRWGSVDVGLRLDDQIRAGKPSSTPPAPSLPALASSKPRNVLNDDKT